MSVASATVEIERMRVKGISRREPSVRLTLNAIHW